jgi:predicted dehydrogenase
MKAAVIGCGRMGVFTSDAVRQYSPACWMPQSHADAILAHPDLTLTALCDPDPAALATSLDRYPGSTGYPSHAALLRDFVPDIVGIATRTVGRTEIVGDFIRAGTHALHVEKPLCNSMTELGALEGLLEPDDVFVTYGTLRRHFTVFQRAVALAASGTLGELCEIRVSMGTSQLFWTHPHSIDILLFAAGARRPVAVQARFQQLDLDDDGAVGEDPVIAAATIWFDDGLAGQIGRTMGSDLMLCCSRGTVRVVNGGERVQVEGVVGDDPYPQPIIVDQAGFVDASPQGTLAPIRQIVACLNGDTDAISANRRVKRDVLLGQRLVFAMVQSHRSGGRLVSLDEVDRNIFVRARSGAFHA